MIFSGARASSRARKDFPRIRHLVPPLGPECGPVFLALAKRVVAKALNRHFVRLVTDAYRHPHLDSHMRIQRAAQLCYGITRNGFPGRGTSRWFLDRVHQAQLDVFRRGSDLDLRVSPIGHDNLVLLCRSSDANSSVVYLYGFSDNLTSFTL